MKRISFTITAILLVGCLFISTEILSKSLWSHDILNKTTPSGITPAYQPNMLKTFNNLFSIYSYEKDVCRKPLGIKFTNLPFYMGKTYQYKGFSYHTQSLGTHYLNVQGNMTYKNGNTLLLVPRSYLMPAKPVFRTERPKVLLSGSN